MVMRLRIGYQVAFVFVIITILTLLIAATALRAVSVYNGYFQAIKDQYNFDIGLYNLRGTVQDQVRIAVQNVISDTKITQAFTDRIGKVQDAIAQLNRQSAAKTDDNAATLDRMRTAYNTFATALQPALQAASSDEAQARKLLATYITPTLDFVTDYSRYAASQNPLENFIYQIDTLLDATDKRVQELDGLTRQAYDDVTRQVAVAGGAALVISALLLFFLTRNLVNPTQQLLEAAEQIGQGNFDQLVTVNSVQEMQQLANAINTMAARLKTSRSETENLAASERQVRERLEKSIGEYTAYLEKVGERNLSSYLTITPNGGNDSVSNDLRVLGESLNKTVASLAAIASQSREIASSTASAAAEILAAVMSQVTGGNEQSSAVVELRTTVEKSRDVSEQTTRQAQGVVDMANRLQETVALGESAIEENVASMDRVRTQTESIASSVLALSERTQAISQIISSVDDLAEQSKILALNAAIEAARAGEAGKSFAVVADEVRNLANQSRQATGRIGEMLGEIQRATNKVVMTTEEGIKQVDAAVQLVRRAGEAIEALAESVERSSESAQQILVATQQQLLGMGQMVEAMDNIERVTAQSVTAGLQTERAAHNLNEMAQRLLQSVEQYRL